MQNVVIDGVTYIPAKQANSDTLTVAKALLLQFWGVVCTDEQARELINDPDIRVLVNDWGEGETLSKVLDDLAALALPKQEIDE